MSHHCPEEPATVGELIVELQKLDPTLPVYETWNENPAWVDVDLSGNYNYSRGREGVAAQGVVWIGTEKCDSQGDGCRNQ